MATEAGHESLRLLKGLPLAALSQALCTERRERLSIGLLVVEVSGPHECDLGKRRIPGDRLGRFVPLTAFGSRCDAVPRGRVGVPLLDRDEHEHADDAGCREHHPRAAASGAHWTASFFERNTNS